VRRLGQRATDDVLVVLVGHAHRKQGVSMPMRIRFSPLPDDRRPRSATASFTSAWSRDANGRSEVEQTVERWRRGIRSAA
jgi:hypothetical protein